MADATANEELTMESSHRDTYRPDVDGLRAVAVLAVMIYHANKAWLPGGFLGVDVFFVISGFVVTHSLAQYVGKKSSGEGVFLSFYARRAKRLLPASLFMISLVGLLAGYFIPPWTPRARRYFQSGRFALISWANNYYAGLKTSYFDTGQSFLEANPFTHTWSLGVEEQFYFIFPLVLMLAYGASLETLPNSGHLKVWPIVVLGGVSACSIMVAWCLPSDTAFFILPSRLWELASGALLFELLSSCGNAGMRMGARERQVASAVLQLSALVLLGFSLIHCPAHGTQFSLPVILPAVCGALCFIAAGSTPHAYLNNCLSHGLFVYIGKLSYPLYLMHWPVMVFCMWAFGLESVRDKLICIAMSVLLGAFTYHVVEAPFRAWRPVRSWIVLPMMGAGILLVYGWLIAVERRFWSDMWVLPEYSAQPHVLLSGPHVFQGLGELNKNSSSCGCRQVDTTWHKPPCARDGESAETLAPCFVETPPTALRCSSTWCTAPSWEQKENIDKCSDGSCLMLTQESKPKTIFLIGDCSAMNLHDGLRKATQGRFIVKKLARGGCQWGPMHGEPSERAWCDENVKKATAEVVNSFQAGDLIVLSNKWVLSPLRSEEWFSQFSIMLDSLYKGISALDGKILIFGPRVDLLLEGVKCVPTVFNETNPVKCERSLADVRESLTLHRSRMANISHTNPGIKVFDYQELLCDDRTCGAFVPGTKTLAYTDKFHLTSPGSKYLAPYICDFMHFHDLVPEKAGLIPEKAAPASAIQIGKHRARGYLRQSRGKLISRT